MKRYPFRAAVMYFLAASTWIIITDLALERLDTRSSIQFQAAKGLLFVLATSIILYLVATANYKRMLRKELDYTRMFQGSPHAIIIYDVETLKILKANHAFLEKYEYSYKEIEKLSVIDMCVPEDRLTAIDFIQKVMERPSSDSGIWRQLKKSGTVFYASITSHSTRFKKRSARIIIITDVDEQMKAKGAIQSSEKKLKSLIDNTSDIIFMIDTQYNIITVNSAYEQFYREHNGVPMPALPMPLADLPQSNDGEMWLALARRVLQGESVHVEQVYSTKTDGEVCYDVVLNPIYDVYEDVIGIGCFSRDITLIRKTEKVLSKQLEQLRQIAWIQSHELRQPLTNIMGIAYLIEEDKDMDRVKEHIALLHKACTALDNVVRGIVKKTTEVE